MYILYIHLASLVAPPQAAEICLIKRKWAFGEGSLKRQNLRYVMVELEGCIQGTVQDK